MHADRYTKRNGLDAGAVALALGGTALFLFGLSLTAPHFVRDPEKHLIVEAIKQAPPPPLKVPPPKPQPRQKDVPALPIPRTEPVEVTKPAVQPTSSGNLITPFEGTTTPEVGVGSGDFPLQPAHVPVELMPQLDARYASAFQPEYPLGEKQAEHEGRVVVRVLIGTDGRVKAVEQVSAASAAFFEATRRRALEKWRFRPGTRDGVPVEAWRTVGVTFQIEQ